MHQVSTSKELKAASVIGAQWMPKIENEFEDCSR